MKSCVPRFSVPAQQRISDALASAADWHTRRFGCFACFDWSGQNVARPKGIALATIDAAPDARPRLHRPAEGWSREDALNWLLGVAARGENMLIGMDVSPTFPFADQQAYFPGWSESPSDAPALWAMVEKFSQRDPYLGAASFLTHDEARRYFRMSGGHRGDRFGDTGVGRLRAVEHHQRATGQANSASCFNLVGAAQVGKASLTAMRVFHRLNGAIPFWPFDPVPETGPVLVEIYTTIAAREATGHRHISKIRERTALAYALNSLGAPLPARLGRFSDHHADALVTAAWLRCASLRRELWHPEPLSDEIRRTEGWTFGVI